MDATRLDPDHPPFSSWLFAVLAAILAIAATVAMARLANDWAKHAEDADTFAVIAAIGGAIVFEFAKYALTVKRRHREAVETEFRLSDIRVEQVRTILAELKKSQEAYRAVGAAIELRARELFLKEKQKQLVDELQRLEQVTNDLQVDEQRLAIAMETIPVSEEVRERLETLLTQLHETRPSLAESVMEDTLRGLPFGMGTVALSAYHLVKELRERQRLAEIKRSQDTNLQTNKTGKDIDRVEL